MMKVGNGILIYCDSTSNTASATMPKKATAGSAGYDVCSIENKLIYPGEQALISTGLYMVMPDGYECQIRPRSGLAVKHGITIINSPSTIDSDYRGEIKVPLINHGKEAYVINAGERIGQFVFVKLAELPVDEITKEHFDQFKSYRGTGGFGSTGK